MLVRVPSRPVYLFVMKAKLPDTIFEVPTIQFEGRPPIAQETYEQVKRRIMFVDTFRVPIEQGMLISDSSSRKVDWRILPLLGMLSALSLIDRSNLGLARAVGMDHALVPVSSAYLAQHELMYNSSALERRGSLQHCLFCILRSLRCPVCPFRNIMINTLCSSLYCSQLPSNLLLRKFRVVPYLSLLVIAWGAVQISMGFVPNWQYLALFRALLGAFEVNKLFIPRRNPPVLV